MYDQILPAVSVTFIPMYCIYMYNAVYTIYLRQISIMFRPSHFPTYDTNRRLISFKSSLKVSLI